MIDVGNDNGKARLKTISQRMGAIEKEVGRKYPDRNPIIMADLVSQEWHDLLHEAGQIQAYRAGACCALCRERRFYQAFVSAIADV